MKNNQLQKIVAPLMAWYAKNARVLPWRSDPKPYHVWVSEIMLQQTRVEAAIPYYLRFLQRFPTIFDLAQAEEDDYLKMWEGLGYYARVRNMHKAACLVCEKYRGFLPKQKDLLAELPGIGEYTAGAIASIAYGQKTAAVDGNVMRIYSRLTEAPVYPDDLKARRNIAAEIEDILPEDPSSFNQALMDLGATVCLPNTAPLCGVCPLSGLCLAHKHHTCKQFPPAKAKQDKPIEAYCVFLIHTEEKIVLSRRGNDGLLKNMWEFPNAPGKYDAKWLEDQGIARPQTALLGMHKHIFTHRIWEMTGYEIRLGSEVKIPDTWVWVKKQELETSYPMPKAFGYFKKYLRY